MERDDEPLTPAGRLFLRPEIDQIITCIVGLKNPIDIDATKSEISDSAILRHPRFCSLLVRDSNGREYWRRTTVNIDDHLIIRHEPLTDDPFITEEDAINDYLADLAVSSPLSVDKPLWEVHLLMAHKCSVFRGHHALGDGISLMSMLLTCCRRVDNPNQLPTIGGVGSSRSSSSGLHRRWTLWRVLKVVWYTLIFMFQFILRSLWLTDKRTTLTGGAGVELWPRKLATAKFSIDDMKTVKRAVTDATINDVLFGIISRGLSQYLDIRSPNALQEGIQITGLAMVNLRAQPGLQEFTKLLNGSNAGIRLGNQFGMILLPVYYHKEGDDVLQFVKKAKAMIDKKKQSLEAPFSYKIGNFVMSCFGPKFASLLNYQIICNTTFTISNVVGPLEEIMIVGNPITYMRGTSTSLPHAITMHMLSYAGRADMQILVAKDIIPDPQVLAKCFENALLEMKELAVATTKS